MKLDELRDMPIYKLMNKKLPKIHEDDDIHHVLRHMRDTDITIVPVYNSKGGFVGSIAKQDLLKVVIDPKNIATQKLMGEPLLGMSFFPKKAKDMVWRHQRRVNKMDRVESVARKMYELDTFAFPVFDGDEFLGVVSKDDVLRAALKCE